jgi:NADPH2 dehydrogenase
LKDIALTPGDQATWYLRGNLTPEGYSDLRGNLTPEGYSDWPFALENGQQQKSKL